MGGGAEVVLPAIFRVPRLRWMRKIIQPTRTCLHFLILMALAVAQLVIAYVGNIENNKGVNYAAFVGALFTFLRNVSVSIDKAEQLLRSTQLSDPTSEKVPRGMNNLGFLPNLIRFPMVVFNGTFFSILKFAF